MPASPCPLTIRIEEASSSGENRPLVSAPENGCIEWEWLSGSRLVASVKAVCPAFHGPILTEILLIDVASGGSQSLTGGFVDVAYLEEAPGGGRLLTTQTRLRLYSDEGVLLRDYGPPPAGYAYYQRVWSPDGTSLAFLLGPANWIFGP
jgi:hypothetical protein